MICEANRWAVIVLIQRQTIIFCVKVPDAEDFLGVQFKPFFLIDIVKAFKNSDIGL